MPAFLIAQCAAREPWRPARPGEPRPPGASQLNMVNANRSVQSLTLIGTDMMRRYDHAASVRAGLGWPG
jgi:hypothetical protein